MRFTIALASLFCILALGVSPSQASIVTAIAVTVDENGNGSVGEIPLDTGEGGDNAGISYILPFLARAGDVWLTEPSPSGQPTISDHLNFNPVRVGGFTILTFYSDGSDGMDSLADINPFEYYPTPVSVILPEVVTEGNNGAVYQPDSTQPGIPIHYIKVNKVFVPVPTGDQAKYTFISDAIPEPGSLVLWSLLGLGSLIGLPVLRRRGNSLGGAPAGRHPWSDNTRNSIRKVIERGRHQ